MTAQVTGGNYAVYMQESLVHKWMVLTAAKSKYTKVKDRYVQLKTSGTCKVVRRD